MSTSRHIDKICCVVTALCLLFTVVFMDYAGSRTAEASRAIGYESRLFDQSRVHSLNIVMDDWESFLSTCTSEEYSACTLIIDGETYKNVGIRGKGNTSLSNVAAYGNNRYSFKVEFDKYADGYTYHGLDKLSLNNLIQDNTYLKDYVCYTLMNQMDVASPLCSFVYITVNGEDWGLYLAVEGVEESFLQRNYGTDYGNLYKPDSMSFGGGRGNGMDFDMDEFREQWSAQNDTAENNDGEGSNDGNDGNGGDVDSETTAPDSASDQDGFGPSQGDSSAAGNDFSPSQGGSSAADAAQISGIIEKIESGDIDPSQIPEMIENGEIDFNNLPGMDGNGFGGFGKDGGGFGGMGSSDVKLQYIDDDPESYSNIFDNAKTDVTSADKERLIASLKQLSEGENIADVVDTDAVIRYLVVHNFVCNGDSYTGSMIHNYYLYEEDGVLSMIPWDYNLAFGGFSGGMGGFGGASSGAASEVNSPIDSPVDGDISDRPMVAWIFADEACTKQYHQYYQEFITSCFDSGYFEELLDQAIELISPYVEKDPTAFCTYEEFQTGVETLRQFCLLRAKSVNGQLDGSIPSTDEGQTADSSALVDASNISISDMGSMGGAMDGGKENGGGFGGFGAFGDMMGGFGQGSDGNIPATPGGAGQNNDGSAMAMPGATGQNGDGSATAMPGDTGQGSDGNAPAMSGDTGQGGDGSSPAMPSRQDFAPSNGSSINTPDSASMTDDASVQSAGTPASAATQTESDFSAEAQNITEAEAGSASYTQETVPYEDGSAAETQEAVPDEAESPADTRETVPDEAESPADTQETVPDEAESSTDTRENGESAQAASNPFIGQQQGNIQMPDANNLPGNFSPGGTDSPDPTQTLVLLAASVIILIIGIIIAKKYRK